MKQEWESCWSQLFVLEATEGKKGSKKQERESVAHLISCCRIWSMSTFLEIGKDGGRDGLQLNEDFTYYRVTGKQSIERIKPLLQTLDKQLKVVFIDIDDIVLGNSDDIRLDFVWETTCEKAFRAAHNNALVLNKLHNSQVIESKSSLAFLQLKMDYPHVLETFVAESASDVKFWVENKWLVGSSNLSEEDWWAVKASRGNGGRDVWVMNKSNAQQVLGELPGDDEYVIQR